MDNNTNANTNRMVKNMLKRIVFAVLATISINAVIISDSLTYNMSENIQSETDHIEALEEVTDENTPIYYLSEYDGRIGVYSSNMDTVVKIINQNIQALPERDREYLEEGIPVYSAYELQSIIDCYTS